MEINAISEQVLTAAIAIHRDLGPGLLESVYELVLTASLERRGLRVRRQQPVSFVYDGMTFNDAFRIDLLVEDTIVVEIKSVSKLEPVFARQLLTYIRLMQLPLGLLVNFGGETLVSGYRRVANNAPAGKSYRRRVRPDS